MKNSLKIGLTCFMGALLGAFVGLQFTTTLGLLISIVVGGLAGYLLYELPAAIAAVPVAYKYAQGLKMPKITISKEKMKTYSLVYVISIYLTLIFQCVLLSIVYGAEQALTEFLKDWQTTSAVIKVAICFMVLAFSFSVSMVIASQGEGEKVNIMKARKISWWIIKFMNPILLPFTVIYYAGLTMLGAIAFIVELLGDFIKFAQKFGWKLFKLIHSDIRLICMVDAAIGAGVGYLYGDSVVGGLIGAALGIVNYWLVSIKWLKLDPKA